MKHMFIIKVGEDRHFILDWYYEPTSIIPFYALYLRDGERSGPPIGRFGYEDGLPQLHRSARCYYAGKFDLFTED